MEIKAGVCIRHSPDATDKLWGVRGQERMLTCSASGTSFGIPCCLGGEEGAEVSESQGLGTRGLSESDSPNMRYVYLDYRLGY